MFKTVPIAERVTDFFNVQNHPCKPSGVANTGTLSVRSSGNSPRVVQLTGRIIF